MSNAKQEKPNKERISQERIAITNAIRTPMGKVSSKLRDVPVNKLVSYVFKELYSQIHDAELELDEVILGNVSQPANCANVARVAALQAGIDEKIPAYTVHRNCASGMEAVTTGICKILSGHGDVILAGGAESMTNVPLLFRDDAKAWFERLSRARTLGQKLKLIAKLKLKYFNPVMALKLGLTDPVCNLNMGQTAEILARDFAITRQEQDEFACMSHNRAEKAMKDGILKDQILPITLKNGEIMKDDEGVRFGQTTQALAKLKPFFDRNNGTVTAGNASQITDGAAATIIMRESLAKERQIKPLGYVEDFVYSGLEPQRMGLGPAYSIAQILKRNNLKIEDIDIWEINEAFAAQVIACVKALDSDDFCKTKLGLDKKLGQIPMEKVNIDGGAVALGHPVGMTGNRIIIQALKRLKRNNGKYAIASLCIGGGQGGAVLLSDD